MNYQNKIIGHEMVDPTQLLANPLNFRIHTKVQKDAMRATLKEVGWLDEIIVNRRTGVLINGHMRVDIALTDNEPLVPVRYVDLSEEEQNIALATFDNVAALAGTDRDQLGDLLNEITTTNSDLADFLMSIKPGEMPQYDTPLPVSEPGDYSDQSVGESKWLIVITCSDEWQQADLLQELEEREIECRALSSG